MKSVKAYQRGVLSITQCRATKVKTKRKNSTLFCTVGGTSIRTVLEKVNTESQETDGIAMCRLRVLDMHHSDLSRRVMKAHEVFIDLRQGMMRGKQGCRKSNFCLSGYKAPLVGMKCNWATT